MLYTILVQSNISQHGKYTEVEPQIICTNTTLFLFTFWMYDISKIFQNSFRDFPCRFSVPWGGVGGGISLIHWLFTEITQLYKMHKSVINSRIFFKICISHKLGPGLLLNYYNFLI
jgi:hypothetical protein